MDEAVDGGERQPFLGGPTRIVLDPVAGRRW